MENVDVFFTDGKGLTSTSANHLANIAKEQLKATQSQLNNLSFVDKEVELINGTKKLLRKGKKSIDLKFLLEKIGNMHSFIAWIREAIKVKEDLLKKIEQLSLEEFARLKNIEVPEVPEKPKYITEENVISEMNIKERNNYLTLESFASAYGNYIHPDGKIAIAREDVLFREQIPCEVDGEGRDMVIYSYTPTISSEEIDKTFMKLQSQYREYEKQLNAIKFSIKEKVNKKNLELQLGYKQSCGEYSKIYSRLLSDLGIYITTERERISKLKIVIPEKLQGIYQYLEELGK